MRRATQLGLLAALVATRLASDATGVLASSSQDGSVPEIVGPGVISTDAPEFATTLSPDGREIYFNRASAD